MAVLTLLISALSQPAYRRRRDEEQKKLPEEVRMWKEKCKDLNETYKKIHVVLNRQRKDLSEMEEEKK